MIAVLLVVTIPIVVGGLLTVVSRDTSRPWFMMLAASAVGLPVLTVSIVMLLMMGQKAARPLLELRPEYIGIGIVGGLVSVAVFWKVLS